MVMFYHKLHFWV